MGTKNTQPEKRGVKVCYKHLPSNIKRIIKREQEKYEQETGAHLSLTRAVYRLLEKLS